MEQINEFFGFCVTRKHNLLLSFGVNKGLDCLVKGALAPPHVQVETLVQKVHKVSLTQISKPHKLLSWQTPNRHIIQITNRDPLLNMTGQKDDSLQVSEEISEKFLKDLNCYVVRVVVCDLRNYSGIHNNGRSVKLISTTKIDCALLQ